MAKPTRVLIVRPSALGDVGRTVPIAASISHAFKQQNQPVEIHWLVNRGYEPLIEAHPAIDRVISFDRKGLSKFGLSWSATKAGLSLAKALRQARYDIVYDMQGLARSGLLTFLTRAKRRVGFADAREMGWLGYNVKHRVSLDIRHTVDRMLGLLEADGVEPIHDLTLYLSEENQAWLKQWQQAQQLTQGYVLVAPTARWESKCWPIDRYVELTCRVCEARPDWSVVVMVSPSEQLIGEQFTQAVTQKLPSLNVVMPQTHVGQMMAVVGGCELMLCNDSGPLHLGVGLGRRTVSFFGPTDPAEVGPYRQSSNVIQTPCTPEERERFARDRQDRTLIKRITVEQAWELTQCVMSK